MVHFLIFLGHSADYRTIGGVSGPLVIVDSVKVCSCFVCIANLSLPQSDCDPMHPVHSASCIAPVPDYSSCLQ